MISQVKEKMNRRVLLLRNTTAYSSSSSRFLRDGRRIRMEKSIRKRGIATFLMVFAGIKYLGFLPNFCRIAAITAYIPIITNNVKLKKKRERWVGSERYFSIMA
jgi:hypothetical protein